MNMHATTIATTDTVESLKSRVLELEADLAEAKADFESAEDRIEELEGEVSDLEDTPPLPEEQIRELAQIRTTLKCGRHEDGRERLERVLDEVGGAWRTLA